MNEYQIMARILDCPYSLKNKKRCKGEDCTISNGFRCVFWVEQILKWAQEGKACPMKRDVFTDCVRPEVTE